MKELLWGVVWLGVVGFASPAWAQLSGRCGGDDSLTPQQVTGRNAWARKCHYISATKEAILNADNEYQVFANGCFQYPCSSNNCQFFVPVSPSAPCITGLVMLGSCVARAAPPPPGSLQAYLEGSWADGPGWLGQVTAGETDEESPPRLYCSCPVSYLQGGARRESSLAPCPVGYCDACGDGRCGLMEDAFTCPPDCVPASQCGDGVCDTGEDEAVCPSDCYCGDGLCNAESVSTCRVDCGCTSQ
ncbi:hypothetical protein [Myxococcus stipitatus]|uniref:hypothetical protein n=1 Tax=Myxococcus stipitatus TaxID=83455 RepID=UPI0030CAA77F